MTSRSQRLQKRNHEIQSEFNLMVVKQRKQIGYTCETLAQKYHLSERTIYLIVKELGTYKKHQQHEK